MKKVAKKINVGGTFIRYRKVSDALGLGAQSVAGISDALGPGAQSPNISSKTMTSLRSLRRDVISHLPADGPL